MKNRRTLAQARDELIKAQNENCSVEEVELQIVREFADGRRRAIGVPAGGLEYEPIPDAVWLQAIGKGWGGRGKATLEGSFVQVDFEESSAIARTGAGFLHIRVLDPAAPDDEFSPPRAPSTSTSQPQKNPGGRPDKYDWERMWIEVVRIANTPDGLPARPVLMDLLYDKMIEWGWEPLPSESALKKKLSRLYNSLNLNE